MLNMFLFIVLLRGKSVKYMSGVIHFECIMYKNMFNAGLNVNIIIKEILGDFIFVKVLQFA